MKSVSIGRLNCHSKVTGLGYVPCDTWIDSHAKSSVSNCVIELSGHKINVLDE